MDIDSVGFGKEALRKTEDYKKEIDEIVFIFEPNGSYSEMLRKFCFEKEITCFIINPNIYLCLFLSPLYCLLPLD